MHRVLALLLVPALLATFALPASLHTHAYGDHDHPEHHHGLSAHEHEVPATHPDDGRAHLEGCNPGRHTVSYPFVCATTPPVHAADAELTVRATPNADMQADRCVRHADVRVHGPPPRTQSSPRAPPLIAHA